MPRKTQDDQVVPGRFVVKLQPVAQAPSAVVLAAHEVQALLADGAAAVREIRRIHRVYDDGRMELIGVAPEAFRQDDCLVFLRRQVREARQDYDALIALAGRTPPPCQIELQMSYVKDRSPPHAVVLIFCAACSEAVGQWICASGLRPGDVAQGSQGVLHEYQGAGPQVVKRRALEPESPSERE